LNIATHFLTRVSLQREKVANFERYPFNLPALKDFEKIDLHPRLTFLVGENGSGKSTLLEAIAVALGFNPEGGTRNFSFSTRPSHSDLADFLRLAQGSKRPRDGFFLRAESFFNVATEIERMDAEPSAAPPVINAYGGRSLHEQSHGESFLALLNHRFGGNGLYLLDEPEAALSPQRQLAVLARIHQLTEKHSQFVIATHSPIFLAYPQAWIYQCSESGIQKIAYDDAEPVRVTRDFLANPKRTLDDLLKPEGNAD
jgi:predicted ATPase